MANPFDQFDQPQQANPFDQFDQPQQANPFDQFDQPVATEADLAAVAESIREPSLLEKGIDLVTGRSQRTEDIEGLREVGAAPELNQFDVASLKAAFGLLATGDTEKGIGIVRQIVPGAGVRRDEKGNVIFDFPSGEYVLNDPGVSAQDFTRFIAQAAAFTPAARLSTIPRVAGGTAATEAGLQAGAAQVGGGEVDPAEVAIAGALGGAFKSFEDVANAIARYRRGAVPEEQRQILQAGEEAGVPVMTTDVIPPETLAGKLARSTGEAVPIGGTGAKRAAQQRGREGLVEQFTEGVAPRYDEVVASLRAKTDKVRQSAGARLGRVMDQMDEVGAIPTQKTLRAIDDEIAALSAPGRVPDEATIAQLQRYREAVEAGQDARALDTLRSDFREQVKGDRTSLPTRSEAAMNRIYSAMTDDLKDGIGNTLGQREAQRWLQAKGVYAREYNQLKKTRLKQVLDRGDVTPESVRNVLMSQKPSELNALYRSLTPDGRAAARVTILDDVVTRLSKRATGLTPNAFATELNRIRPQINAFFKGEEKEQLLGLQKFLDATRRAQDAAVATPTGQSLMGILIGGGAVTDLGATAAATITPAVMARVYESPMVRNALLRLSGTRRGSTAFDTALDEVNQAIAASVQAVRASEDKAPDSTSEEQRR